MQHERLETIMDRYNFDTDMVAEIMEVSPVTVKSHLIKPTAKSARGKNGHFVDALICRIYREYDVDRDIFSI